MVKKLILFLLERKVRRLIKKYKPKLVAVVGSVGKTSTKIAIATVLAKKYRVLAQYGNYNTPTTVPLAMFGLQLPANVRSPIAWWRVLRAMNATLRRGFAYDVIVFELGTDAPGDLIYFKKYLQPDIAVVTAVAPEHMEFFGTIDAVAKEELSVVQFSRQLLVNRDDIASQYSAYVPDGTAISTYGTSAAAEYQYITQDVLPGEGFSGVFVSPEYGEQKAQVHLIGEHNVRAVAAAGAVGVKLGVSAADVVAGIQDIRAVHGRMNVLRGVRGTTIIDDTYNSSPTAAIAALQTLYVFPATQRIAILGSMNELGEYSQTAHKQVGEACDPAVLDWVITIGDEAKQYLAPAAEARGCRVRSFVSPYEAGACANKLMERGAVVLVKGSQNRIFAEEATKVLLHNAQDEALLVRQSPEWMAKKQAQFDRFAEPV